MKNAKHLSVLLFVNQLFFSFVLLLFSFTAFDGILFANMRAPWLLSLGPRV